MCSASPAASEQGQDKKPEQNKDISAAFHAWFILCCPRGFGGLCGFVPFEELGFSSPWEHPALFSLSPSLSGSDCHSSALCPCPCLCQASRCEQCPPGHKRCYQHSWERCGDFPELSPELARGHFSNALPSNGAICKRETKKPLQQMRNSSLFIQLCSQRSL